MIKRYIVNPRIELAVQWTGDNTEEIRNIDEIFVEYLEDLNVLIVHNFNVVYKYNMCSRAVVRLYDYLVRDVNGSWHPYKKDKFEELFMPYNNNNNNNFKINSNMENCVKSMIDEHAQLVVRTKALNDYVYSERSANDDRVEFANKCIQLACMKKYEECLRARLENAGVHFVNGHYLEDVAKIEANPSEDTNGDNDDKQVVLE